MQVCSGFVWFVGVLGGFFCGSLFWFLDLDIMVEVNIF